ncbi:hypothetical protein [Brevundimonas sp.]|uniref:hypothetical protein n=1 Tax=Brevundimonas sp. TaxID=1871086 RepID=UPI00289E49D3|nr:hypothetical protein [Brevundimonas sp.]
MTQVSLRRLIDLPGVDDLELKALMKPRYADPDAREEFPEIDALTSALFGLTGEAAEAVALPDDWDDIHRLEGGDLAEAFEALGWDVTDKRRKPLRLMPHYALPLALAIRGVAGELPFHVEPDHPATDWGSGLAADAARFRKR